MSKYGVFSGPYFPAFGMNTERYEVSLLFSPNAGKYSPGKTPYSDTFHAVLVTNTLILMLVLTSFCQVKDLMVHFYRIIIYVVNYILIKL